MNSWQSFSLFCHDKKTWKRPFKLNVFALSMERDKPKLKEIMTIVSNTLSQTLFLFEHLLLFFHGVCEICHKFLVEQNHGILR